MTPARPWLPYVAPFGVYMLFLLLQSRLSLESLAYMYPLRALVVAGVLVCFWRAYVELRPRSVGEPGLVWERHSCRDPGVPVATKMSLPQPNPPPASLALATALGILVGAVAIFIWIAIDPFYPSISRIFGHLSNLLNYLGGDPIVEIPPPEVFNPDTMIAATGLRWTFIAFRVFGAVVVVAFMEELFWRGFLIRWLIDEDFQKVPVGTFTWSSFLVTVLFFGLEHDQWLAGMICGALYNWLYYRTRSIPACVIAHAVSNALLAAWVLWQQDWKLW